MRRLILVPIVHTQADLGSLQESVRRHHVQKAGEAQWKRRQAAVADLWNRIRSRIDVLDLDYGHLRLYQDGLPVCGHEEAIVRNPALRDSANYQLLLDLMAKGATLTGTESLEFLLKEYELAREAVASAEPRRTPNRGQKRETLSRTVLNERDSFIAKQIDQTLKEGETGLIFLGMLHSIERKLPSDIQLVRLNVLPVDRNREDTVPQKDS